MSGGCWPVESDADPGRVLAGRFLIANDGHPCQDAGLHRGMLQDEMRSLVLSDPEVLGVIFSKKPCRPRDVSVPTRTSASDFPAVSHLANVVELGLAMRQDFIEGHLRPPALFVKRARDFAMLALPLVIGDILNVNWTRTRVLDLVAFVLGAFGEAYLAAGVLAWFRVHGLNVLGDLLVGHLCARVEIAKQRARDNAMFALLLVLNEILLGNADLASAILAFFRGFEGREDLFQGQIAAFPGPPPFRGGRVAAHGADRHPARATLAREVPVFALEDLLRRDGLADDALDDVLYFEQCLYRILGKFHPELDHDRLEFFMVTCHFGTVL